jgi:hypothetical protein
MTVLAEGTRVVLRDVNFKTATEGKLRHDVEEGRYGVIEITEDDGGRFRTEGRAYRPARAVVEHPDSVTHFLCDSPSADGRTHHINHHGVCAWCKVSRRAIAEAVGVA